MAMARRKNKPPIVPDPPLESLRSTLDRAGKTIRGVRAGSNGDPESNLHKFVGKGMADLTARSVGNWKDLSDAYLNGFMASKFLVDVSHALEAVAAQPHPRAQGAGVNIMAASYTLLSALVLHLRVEPWNDRAAMALARTALESTGRAALIATGTANEATRWENEVQFTAKECVVALDKVVAKRREGARPASAVYEWLCNFAHMNTSGLRHFFDGPATKHEDTYAALAYVSWATAVVAELVFGDVEFAQWPRFPETVPWDRTE